MRPASRWMQLACAAAAAFAAAGLPAGPAGRAAAGPAAAAGMAGQRPRARQHHNRYLVSHARRLPAAGTHHTQSAAFAHLNQHPSFAHLEPAPTHQHPDCAQLVEWVCLTPDALPLTSKLSVQSSATSIRLPPSIPACTAVPPPLPLAYPACCGWPSAANTVWWTAASAAAPPAAAACCGWVAHVLVGGAGWWLRDR